MQRPSAVAAPEEAAVMGTSAIGARMSGGPVFAQPIVEMVRKSAEAGAGIEGQLAEARAFGEVVEVDPDEVEAARESLGRFNHRRQPLRRRTMLPAFRRPDRLPVEIVDGTPVAMLAVTVDLHADGAAGEDID